MLITPNFTREEFERSNKATALAIDNAIRNADVFRNITLLCQHILQPLRDRYAKPITVTSGYRCPALNNAVGGSATSQHLKGQAADIKGASRSENATLFALIQSMHLPFDQLICEQPDKQGRPAWVHVSYSNRHRRQVIWQ